MKIANPAGNLGMQDFCETHVFLGVEWKKMTIWDGSFFGDFHRELGEGLKCLDVFGFEVFFFEIFEVFPPYYMTAPPKKTNIFTYIYIFM